MSTRLSPPGNNAIMYLLVHHSASFVRILRSSTAHSVQDIQIIALHLPTCATEVSLNLGLDIRTRPPLPLRPVSQSAPFIAQTSQLTVLATAAALASQHSPYPTTAQEGLLTASLPFRLSADTSSSSAIPTLRYLTRIRYPAHL